MAVPQSDLIHFIIDLDDDECPQVDLHVAAYQGQLEVLETQLQLPGIKELVDSRVRPFLATPLRLAATGMCECLCIYIACYVRLLVDFV